MFSFRTALAAGALTVCAPVFTAEVQEVTVERNDARYLLTSKTLFDADQGEIFRVLTDYDEFEQISSVFVDSKNLEPDDEGRPRFYTEMEGCVLFFCVTFERYGHLELEPDKHIRAVVDPHESDFKHSVESWKLEQKEDGVLLVYEFEMEPDFWVPPIIGPYFIRKELEDGAVRAVDRIEALAQGREPANPVRR